MKEKHKEAILTVYLMKKFFENNSSIIMEEIKEYCFSIKLSDITRRNC